MVEVLPNAAGLSGTAGCDDADDGVVVGGCADAVDAMGAAGADIGGAEAAVEAPPRSQGFGGDTMSKPQWWMCGNKQSVIVTGPQ